MGTRNLTCAVIDDQYRIAQYGQWDGYPEGQGVTALDILRGTDLNLLAEKLRAVREVSEEQWDAAWVEAGADPNNDTNLVPVGIANTFGKMFPHLHRDAGAEILRIVIEWPAGLAVRRSLAFAGDSLSCEWCYVADLDLNTFEVFEGFNEEPLPEGARFAWMPQNKAPENAYDDTKYYPVRLRARFPLDDLPDAASFVSAVKAASENNDVFDLVKEAHVFSAPVPFAAQVAAREDTTEYTRAPYIEP
jgi:hypothetical protein